MEYVNVSGLPPMSKVGLGTMRFGEKTFDPDLARALVRRALELGINSFDTAEAYGWGRGERMLGEALRAEGATDAVVSGGSQLQLFSGLPQGVSKETLDYSQPDATGALLSKSSS